MVPNFLKLYETHQNMSLGSNGVDRVFTLPKIPMQLRGTNFCINCTNSDHFALSLVRGTEFRFQWGGLGAFVAKIPTRLRGTNFCIVQPVLHRVS